jgi:hypothetical protein
MALVNGHGLADFGFSWALIVHNRPPKNRNPPEARQLANAYFGGYEDKLEAPCPGGRNDSVACGAWPDHLASRGNKRNRANR